MQYLIASRYVSVAVCLVLLAGCATTTQNNAKINPADPYESFNRPVHKFNAKVDDYIAKPIADAYKWVTPEFLQTGVNNFFSNLQDVNVILNDILQAKFKQGAQDVGRLTLNTTVGLGGLIDVASKAGLDKHNEDFGQTLAVWGLPQGHYLVLPFLGPTTFRELPGYVVDAATNPATYVTGFTLPLAGANMLNTRARAEGSLQFINEAALDPYVFMRESYLQWRNYQAVDGKVAVDKNTEALEDELLSEDNFSAASQNAISKPDNTASNNVAPTRKALPTSTEGYEAARRKFHEAQLRWQALKNKSTP